MFRRRHSLRRWAAAVLLLWLFGVVSGVAHACLIPAPATETRAVVEARAQTVAVKCHEGHVADQRAAEGAHDADMADCHVALGKSGCQTLCDKASVSIPPLKSVLDDLQWHALLPMWVATADPVPARVPLRIQPPRRDGVAGPPITIAFLRLAL